MVAFELVSGYLRGSRSSVTLMYQLTLGLLGFILAVVGVGFAVTSRRVLRRLNDPEIAKVKSHRSGSVGSATRMTYRILLSAFGMFVFFIGLSEFALVCSLLVLPSSLTVDRDLSSLRCNLSSCTAVGFRNATHPHESRYDSFFLGVVFSFPLTFLLA